MTTDTGNTVEIPRTLTVRELADLLNQKPVQVIKVLMTNGVMADVSKTIDFDTAAVVAADLGFDPIETGDVVEEPEAPVLDDLFAEPDDPAATRLPRPPVITTLGHVDHGKTSLLDRIRQANVAAGEAGGITQHIGAYQAEIAGRRLTFLDTPGHEAFTAMRARGANATDIAILVVAANDGVMPQTREAINHIRAAGVPLVVALNKIDTNNANPDRVKAQLAEAGVQIEEYGGDVPCVATSALTGEGMDALLETLLLVADIQDLRANPNRAAAGLVLEGELDRRQGVRATLLVQRGTLHVGDAVLVGETWGKVKAMFDPTGARLDAAGPSTPVAVLGLQDVPGAGDKFRAMPSDRDARTAYGGAKRGREAAEAQMHHAASLDALFGEISRGVVKELNLVLKTDVEGSVQPLRDSLEQLSNEEVHVKVIHAAPGPVSESDVNLALAAHGIVLAFNTRGEPGALRQAAQTGVEIRTYQVIYQVIEEVEAAISGMLEPVDIDVVDAHAEVLQIFSIRKIGNVAGCRADDGTIRRDQSARVTRSGAIVASGKISSLRRFQQDTREVQPGQEFGVGIDGWDQWEPGDTIEFFHVERHSRVVSGGKVQTGPTQT